MNGFMARIGARSQGVPVPVEFVYNADDPMAVTLVFHGATNEPWTVSRELLWTGQVEEIGDGDVHLTPTDDGVEMLLSSRVPGGVHAATILLNPFDLWTALSSSFVVCPRECEGIDWKYEIHHIGGAL